MLYRVTVHAPVPEHDDAPLDRLRKALEGNRLEVNELRTEEVRGGRRLCHLETTIEALSAYDAREVSGLNVFARLFEEAGMPVAKAAITISAERATDAAP